MLFTRLRDKKEKHIIMSVDTDKATECSVSIIILKALTFGKPEIKGNFIILIKVIQQRLVVNTILNEETLGIFPLRTEI
jgi:hypothetical protein